METPTLETDRLILRGPTLDDAPAIQKNFNNWNIIRHLSAEVPWPYPDDGAADFLRQTVLPAAATGTMLHWAIVPKAGPDECIGLIAFRFEETAGGNRGFWLAEPFWGHGYMTEAITTVQDYVFFDLNIDRFVVINAEGNRASHRVKEKTGAQFLGPAAFAHHDGGTAAEKWEVTRERWARIRNRT